MRKQRSAKRKTSPGEPKTCFVVGPIGAEESDTRVHADWVLHAIITPVMNKFPEFQVIRADQEPPGIITNQIIRRLHDAELVIADLTFQNPNVFYEIGIRHVWATPIVHMVLQGQPIPFDVSPYRAQLFALRKFSDIIRAQEILEANVRAVLSDQHPRTTPVSLAMEKTEPRQPDTKLTATATPQPPLGHDAPEILVQLNTNADHRTVQTVFEKLRVEHDAQQTWTTENNIGLVLRGIMPADANLSQVAAELRGRVGIQEVRIREF